MPVPHFSVKNFDELQHYKDRNPPWIKFYNASLDDYEIGLLPDASKAHLFAIWLLASRYNNQIPYDADWVGRRINASEPVDLPLLAKHGFIVPDQDCSNMLASRKQDAIPEKEKRESREEREGEKSRARGTRLTDDWKPSESNIVFCLQEGLTEDDAAHIGDCFRDYWIGVAGAKGVKRDWDGTWRNWVRREKQSSGGKPGSKRQEPSGLVAATLRALDAAGEDSALPRNGGVSGNGSVRRGDF